MNIDILFQTIEEPAIDQTIFSGTKYLFCRTPVYVMYGLAENSIGRFDIYGEDAVSVMWTKEELDAFRPDDTVHNFRLRIRNQDEERLTFLKKNIKKQPTEYKKFGKIFNIQKQWESEINYLESHVVHFICVKFI